jgi:hypothetical protein
MGAWIPNKNLGNPRPFKRTRKSTRKRIFKHTHNESWFS